MFSTPLRRVGMTLAVILICWLITRYLLPAVTPFLLALLLALAAEPLVKVLSSRLKLSRGIAAGIGVRLCLTLVVLGILSLGALLLRELGLLAGILPDLEDTAAAGLSSLEGFFVDLADKAPGKLSTVLTQGVEGMFSDGSKILDQVSTKVLDVASGVVTRIPDGALGLFTWVLASFMISARLPRIRAWATSKLPDSWHDQYLPRLKGLKKSLGGWLLAQLKLMGITFCVLCVGFVILRITYAPVWAVLISLVDALPVLGTGTVLIPWSLVCFLQGDSLRAVGLLGTYVAGFLLRSVLEPRLVGKQLGLDPLVTLMAMYAGYRLWGILGMLLSPLIAMTALQLLTGPKQASP